ncbi:restriction endonuclease subunit S [Vibrio vulnificus]|uniref:restriction endonuclease subunit S n=2 Tax=Vibrio vulnificus TaxID=672 RepID=UPI00102C7F4A|nr:restriction endonuclease subunit S [Vibrio vulnificus]EHG1328439.1 restriction endonuclease subunit S [Vibrio vulnificus]EHU5126827.1 restriction endonuclease subunit S [Vibrio vulnificus]EJA3294670.1 restriction endonuclease subunit S [Vibrio vulnificus]RZR40977.1 restriction endonuclease subunit S [Vibrio vulnificus]
MPYSSLEAKDISQLCTVVDCEHKTAPYVEKSDYLVVRTSNVRNGQLLMADMKYTTVDGYNEWTQRAIPEYGDVLFTREAPAGESCLVPKDKKVCMGQRMVMLRPKKDVTDPVFLSLILNTERTKADISRLSIGSTVSRINIADIKKLKVSSPPLPEQRKIAKILSTWDKAITATEKLIETSKQQKKALMQQLLTGKKRLVNPETGKVFEGEWKKVELGELLDYKQPTPYLVKSTEYSSEYSTPVLTAGKTFILGYSNEDFGIFSEELPAIIFDDFTTASKFVDFPFKAKSSAMKILIAKEGVSIKYVYEAMQVLNYPVGGHQRHWISIFANLVIGLPEPEEQQKIASVFTAADKEIEVLEAKLDHLKDEKKALMQQLLTGKRRVTLE